METQPPSIISRSRWNDHRFVAVRKNGTLARGLVDTGKRIRFIRRKLRKRKQPHLLRRRIFVADQTRTRALFYACGFELRQIARLDFGRRFDPLVVTERTESASDFVSRFLEYYENG